MTAIAYYLLKVLICSGILFLYYHLAMKNKIFHQWNRFYLLSAVVLSLLLPLIQFTIWQADDKNINLILFVQSADNYLEEITISSSPAMSPEQWIEYAYSLVCLGFLVSFILAIIKILKIIKTHTVQFFDQVKFINTKEPGAPFSFLHYIFWNEKISLQSDTGQQIFQHELVHVREKHTLDKLFMQIVLVFFWCNPFFWLIRRELKFIHEFIADKKAVGQNSTAAFAAMIVQTSYPQYYHSITNQFFQTSIKRRLLMLTKIQNPRMAYASRIIALPLIAITIFAFTVRTEKKADVAERKALNISFALNANDTIPKSKKEISAVDVSKDKEKRINKLTVTYTDGTSETLTEQEAIKRGLINNGGFGNAKRGSTTILEGDGGVRLKTVGKEQPLFILDEKEISKEEMEKLDPKVIESINVLKGQPAVDKYGEKAKEGAVEIKLKPTLNKEVVVEGHPLKNKEVIVEGYPLENKEVVVEGRPLKNKKETVVTKQPSKNNLQEITVEGYPLKKSEPIFVTSEEPASIDIKEWRKFLATEVLPIVIKATNSDAPVGNYVVNVRFIVNTDGTISDVTALNNPGYGIAAGLISVMDKSPKWIPAKQNGKAVRSYHTQPVTLQISDK